MEDINMKIYKPMTNEIKTNKGEDQKGRARSHLLHHLERTIQPLAMVAS